MAAEMEDRISSALDAFRFDPYILYPARSDDAWKRHFMQRLEQLLASREWSFFYEVADGAPQLLACRIAEWDREHFGMGMASLHFPLNSERPEDTPLLTNMLDDCISFLNEKEVRFVSARVNGDDLPAIHALEAKDFRYYEHIERPIIPCADLPPATDPDVRLMEERDLERVMEIAGRDTFRRSHFFCDPRFDRDAVNSMYTKWFKTSWEKQEPVAVIEADGKVAGAFAFSWDPLLSGCTGYKYGRLKNLVLDSNARGKGLGRRLFNGTLSMIKDAGADYIDSGYASKNHLSARLHSDLSFFSVCEEVTFHLWL